MYLVFNAPCYVGESASACSSPREPRSLAEILGLTALMEEKYTFEGNRAPLSIKPTLKNSWKIRPSALYRVFFLHKSEDPVIGESQLNFVLW